MRAPKKKTRPPVAARIKWMSRCSAVTDRYTGAILPFGTGLVTVFLNRVDRITGTNVLFFTMENHFGLSQGDHNGGVTRLVR